MSQQGAEELGAQERSPLRIGVLGAGMIATTGYGVLPNLKWIPEKATVVAIADPVVERAREAAKEFGIPDVYSTLDAMLEGSELDAVVNLTPITFHGDTSLKILRAGKHLATEKPLATTMEDADAIVEIAAAQGLTVVCSPPDALFPAYQEARRLLDEGTIGKVTFARVRSSHAGPGGSPFGWPADPTWFYQLGSGPLLDMGVYGIHEITALLGPAERVVAFSGITEATRVVRGGPFAGKTIDVTADDNTLFMLDFGGATFAVVDGTFNVHAAKSPKIEMFGRRGVLNIRDGSAAGDGPLEVYRTDALPGLDGWVTPGGWGLSGRQEWFDKLNRAVLVDHLVDSVWSGQRAVLSAEHGRHALEIMLKVAESARTGQALDLSTTF
ncbi:Gfo/Idh/MocA family protein [Actinopolymorpha alba]|uniref:Gfo/Idh/MocA family protein n=1 Tax=Actinopolymorpha alba TaxID=533267 RepID=UPI00037C71B8|nr:Gfo/Idh/MocA family oxidoreductase [Actinopolymorpha alba]